MTGCSWVDRAVVSHGVECKSSGSLNIRSCRCAGGAAARVRASRLLQWWIWLGEDVEEVEAWQAACDEYPLNGEPDNSARLRVFRLG